MAITQRLFGRTIIDSAQLVPSGWYIGSTKITVTAAQLNQLATTKFVTASTLGADVAGTGLSGGNGAAIRLNTSLFHTTLAAGTNSSVNVTVSGMAATDTIVSVISFSTAASITTMTDRTAEYAAGAGVMTKAAGTDETGNQLMINWIHVA